MSKLSNVITMLQLLKVKKKYSINELAKELEVTPRMVRIYKDELEKAGVYIDTIKGKYGGYVLNEKLSDINIGLSKYDIELLKTVGEKLKKDVTFQFNKEYKEALNKILYAFENKKDPIAYTYLRANLDSLDSDMELKKYKEISKAIQEKYKIKIKYMSIDNTIKSRTIQPCDIFLHNESLYVSAFCELRNEIRHFEFRRILEYKILNEKF